MENKRRKILYAGMFVTLLLLVSLTSATATFTEGEFWSRIEDTPSTIVLSDIDDNVNVGENDTTEYKLNVEGDINSEGTIYLKNGIVGNLALTFKGENDSGLYRVTNRNLAWVIGSNIVLTLGDSQVSCTKPFLMSQDNELRFRSGAQYIKSENATTLSINSYYIVFNGTILENMSKMKTTGGSSYGDNCIVTGITTHDDDVYGSQDATYTGTVTGGDLTAIDDLVVTDDSYLTDNAHLGRFLYHYNDADTYIYFEPDNIYMNAGGLRFLHFQEGLTDRLTMNPNGGDIDIFIESDTRQYSMRMDASEDTWSWDAGLIYKTQDENADFTFDTGSHIHMLDARANVINVTLNRPSNAGQEIIIKDMFGIAGTNYINVTCDGCEIDGEDYFLIDENYGCLTVIAGKDDYHIKSYYYP